MKNTNIIKFTFSLLAATTLFAACNDDREFISVDSSVSTGGPSTNNNNSDSDAGINDISTLSEIEKPSNTTTLPDFIYGADFSWLTEQELTSGFKLKDKNGVAGDGVEILKGLGFNVARLRVWVNPENIVANPNAFCNKVDVVKKAVRAQKAGMSVMIDFHFSDYWADPSQQKKPKNWDNLTQEQLKDSAAAHVTDVLSLLKEYNVQVAMVQLGNESSTGIMLTQSDGSEATANGSGDNYVAIHNACVDAAKTVYPNVKIITHFAQGENNNRSFARAQSFISKGMKFDIFGVSIYPYIYNDNGAITDNWYENYVDQLFTNMKAFIDATDKQVMIAEVGINYQDKAESWIALNDIYVRAKNTAGCVGVCYWEPQCLNFSGYVKGVFDPSTNQPYAEFLPIFTSTTVQYSGSEEVTYPTVVKIGGDFNSWAEKIVMTSDGAGTFRYTFTTELSGSLGFYVGDGETWYAESKTNQNEVVNADYKNITYSAGTVTIKLNCTANPYTYSIAYMAK